MAAGSIAFSGDIVTITGTSSTNDNAYASIDDRGTSSIYDDRLQVTLWDSTGPAATQSFGLYAIKIGVGYVRNVAEIRFNGYEGADHIWNNTDQSATLFGGGGNDSLYGGSGTDTLHGAYGRDYLRGG